MPEMPPSPRSPAHDRIRAAITAGPLAERWRALSEPGAARCLELGPGLFDPSLPEAGFDLVRSVLFLCSTPDLGSALRRVRELLAPGGRVVFVEHTAAPGGWGRLQRLVDPVWSRFAGGCHLERDSVSAMRSVELMVSDYDRIPFRVVPGLIDSVTMGTATQRGAPPIVPPGTYPRRRPRGAAA